MFIIIIFQYPFQKVLSRVELKGLVVSELVNKWQESYFIPNKPELYSFN